MKTTGSILAVLALAVSAYGFTGTVVNNKDRPVAEARVCLRADWTSGRPYHADEKGEFVAYRNIAPDGTVHKTDCKIVDPGGQPIPLATALLPFDDIIFFTTDKKGQFTFDLPAHWDGVCRVKDSKGNPIPRAKVIRESMGEVVMDDKGEYAAPDWTPDPFFGDGKSLNVCVVAAGYAYACVTVDSEKTQQATVTLRPERLLKGRIVTEAGEPLEGARVIVEGTNGEMKDGSRFYLNGYSLPAALITSGKNGRFNLHHLPHPAATKAAEIALTIEAPDRAKIERRQYKLADLWESAKIVLPRVCVVQGTLRPPLGLELPDGDLSLKIRLVEDGLPVYESERYVSVKKDGSYKFDNLPPGEAVITLSTNLRKTLGWTLPAVQNLRILPGDVKRLDLAGGVGAVIRGTVRDQVTGKPVGGAALTYEDAANPTGNWWLTEDDGTYAIRMASGKGAVWVNYIYLSGKQVPFDRKDGATVEVKDGQDQSGVDLSIKLPAE